MQGRRTGGPRRRGRGGPAAAARLAAALGALAALLLAGLGAEGAAGAGGDLLLRDARLVDGTGGPVRSGVSILVRDGRIVRIAAEIRAEGLRVLDAAGRTVTPGLVDAHVHLASAPGAVQRGDARETLRALRRAHLRAYLACGVTTVLDTGVTFDVARAIREELDAGAPGPRYLHLGPMLVAPGAYVAASGEGEGDSGAARSGTGWRIEPLTTPDALADALDAFEALGTRGIKVFLEKGFGPRELWPLPSERMRDAVREAARRRDLPIYVHGSHEDEQRLGLEMGARALVHTGFAGSAPSEGFIERLAASGAYVTTTFSLADAPLARFEPARLERPVVELAVPARERETAARPEAFDRLASVILGLIVPELPGPARDALAPWILTEGRLRAMLRSRLAAARRFHEAGVPLVVGSDAGNWPVDPYGFHGPNTLRELELLARAGLAPDEVLAAATRVPAEMLGLEERVGTVEEGKRADLLVLDGDPLRDPSAFRRVHWTIRDGVARTPAQWMRGD